MVKNKNTSANITPRIIIHLIMILFALFCLVPFLLVISTSLMHESDIYISGYTYFPKAGFTLAAYQEIFLNPSQLLHAYLVTIFSTLCGTIVGLWLTLSLGYIVSRKDFKLRKQISFYVFFTMIFSGGLVPSYIMIAGWFKLQDNYLVLIIPYLCIGFNVLIAKGFLQNIPPEIIESAKLDGAGEFKTFIDIVLPISKPAVATVALFIGFNYWNDWFTSYMYMNNGSMISLQYLLVKISEDISFMNSDMARMLIGASGSVQNVPEYTARMAMCVLAALPILFAFPFFQKYFEKGLTIGSVKG